MARKKRFSAEIELDGCRVEIEPGRARVVKGSAAEPERGKWMQWSITGTQLVECERTGPDTFRIVFAFAASGLGRYRVVGKAHAEHMTISYRDEVREI